MRYEDRYEVGKDLPDNCTSSSCGRPAYHTHNGKPYCIYHNPKKVISNIKITHGSKPKNSRLIADKT
jgi:hypothetical protein